jgi:D-3-phosphoglycerate dehydrogenase
MRRDALLVNTSRGGLVDEAALAEALRDGEIGGAGLDVFEDEPPPPDHPLLGLPNVLLSPHVAGVTQEASVRMAVESAENALAGLDGRLDPATVVNPEVRGAKG